LNKSPFIEVQNICKSFDDAGHSLDVLRGITFSMSKREIVAIVGESGAGKSTLLHILGTLDHPTEGKVIVEGRDIFSWNEEERADFRNNTIGFIFQFHNLLPEFDALENVMMPMLIAGADRSVAREKAIGIIDEVGLSNRISHKPGELSGGEQQRIAIARSLVNDPKLVLADEPTGNLDVENGEIVFDLLRKLNREREITFVLVTHNQTLVNKSDRAIRIVGGLVSEENV